MSGSRGKEEIFLNEPNRLNDNNEQNAPNRPDKPNTPERPERHNIIDVPSMAASKLSSFRPVCRACTGRRRRESSSKRLITLSRLKQVKIYAYVIMLDHKHIYWYFLEYGQCLVIMSVILEEFGRGKLAPTNLRKKFNLRNIWQKGFYDNVIFFQ